MKSIQHLLLASVVIALWFNLSATEKPKTLLEHRQDFQTKLIKKQKDEEPLASPLPELFSLVSYPTALGKMSAYLSKPQTRGKKYPAIIWITGGLPPGGIDATAWEYVPPDNDQSAKIYRQSGIIMMYPTVRGSCGNPGFQEGFYGEVNDILSSLDFLCKQPYVDTNRVYLGGHSTGGTLALLVACATDRFRAVFAFGPVADPRVYGAEYVFYDAKDKREAAMRSPINFLASIQSPTFVIEGNQRGNIDSLRALNKVNRNKNVHFIEVDRGTHFTILTPVNRLIAKKIADTSNGSIVLNRTETQVAYDCFLIAKREANELQRLADLRLNGVDFAEPKTVNYFFLSRSRKPLGDAGKDLTRLGLKLNPVEKEKDVDGNTFFVLTATRTVDLKDLKTIFSLSQKLSELEAKYHFNCGGWTTK